MTFTVGGITSAPFGRVVIRETKTKTKKVKTLAFCLDTIEWVRKGKMENNREKNWDFLLFGNAIESWVENGRRN